MRTLLSIIFIFGSLSLQANNMIKVKAIGSSPKGQFVAFEEFGYLNEDKAAFSLIRVKNVWKDHYVDKPIKVISKDGDMELDQVRAQAMKIAKERLKVFNISS